MAFERVLQGSKRDRATSRWTLVGVGIVHGVLVFGGAVHSTWTVEELDPPRVAITLSIPPAFAAEIPAPRVGPRTPGGDGAAGPSHKKPQPSQRHPSSAQTAPAVDESKAGPSEGPADVATTSTGTGDDPGEQDGKSGPGTGSGSGPGDSNDSHGVFAPPTIGAKQCLDCPVPHLSPSYLSVVGQARMLLKICVDRTGRVDRVSVLQGLGAGQDGLVVSTIQGWRYAPMTVNGSAVPFCYASRFTFNLQ